MLTSSIGGFNLDIAGVMNVKTVNGINLTTSNQFHLSSTGNHLTSSGNTEIKSSGNHNETATEIHMNGPQAVAATEYTGLSAKVDPEGNIYFTNTLHTRDETTGNRNTEKVGTILTRFPSREPFAREEFTS